jgi:hypothetical protein
VATNVNYLVNIVFLMTAVGSFGMTVLEVMMCIGSVPGLVDPIRDAFMRPVIDLVLGIPVIRIHPRVSSLAGAIIE